MGKLLLFLAAWMVMVDEVNAIGGITTGYTKKKDSEGHTVYTKKRLIRRSDSSSSDSSSDDSRHRYNYDNDSTTSSTNVVDTVTDLMSLAAAVSQLTSSSSALDASSESTAVPSLGVKYWEEPEEPHWAASLGILGGNNMAHMDLSGDWISDYFDATLGIAYMSSDKGYLGFTGGVRAHLPWKVSPFVGVGFFTGDSETCSTQPVDEEYDEETCDMYVLQSLTYEAGLQARLDRHFQMRVFARYFSNVRQDDVRGDTLYGLSLMLLF